MTNTTDMIFQLCLDNLIPQAKARGIARRFDAKRADDYAGLAHILATAGVSIPAQRAVVEAYRELTASTDGSHDSPDPFAGLTGDSMNPLEGLDAAADKTWAKEMRRRMIEAQVTSAERRARGLDNPNAPTPGTSTAESEAIKIIREQLETTRRELSEVKHQGELKNLETRLSGEIAALKQATAAPTAAEVEARAKSDLTKVVTTELSKRADGAGTIVKTGRERILQNPKLLAKLEHAIETAVDDFDPSNRIPPGMQPHDPSDAELQQLVDEIESRNPAPKPAKPSAEAPRFRIPTRPAEAQPPAPAPSAAPAPEPAGYQSG